MRKGWLIASLAAGIASLVAPIISMVADSKVAEDSEKLMEERITANVLASLNNQES